ncbi:SPOR domain-containing protein [Treponema sp. UBA3813]|uniref:SPOR domain-containing protein n=1 Tax=Treponema sp. UBA3813 TaxID=1947715 RepID=UPI0025D67FAC|nr:SPOR domain-containing protein [Treponema sp. UBA3813]
MKKITFFILTIFTVATLYAAARPSLDGRAVVADSGTMPRGLFARTVGYLPGDSVTVTNPATGSTVDVLILGAIDPSEGVAILLSPEAADELRIKANSNVQVKLTKRSGSLDENANGSAVLSEGSVVEDISLDEEREEIEEKPASFVAETEKSESEKTEIPYEKSVQPVSPQEPEAEEELEEAVVPAPVYTEYPAEEEKPVAETVEPVLEERVIAEEKPAVEEKTFVDEETLVEEKALPEEFVKAYPEEESYTEEEVEPETVYEILPPLPNGEKKQRVVVIPGEEADYEEVVEEKAEPVAEVPEETSVVAEVPEETPVVAEEIPLEEEVLPDGIEAEPAVVMVEPEAEAEPVEEAVDEYQPIILVPADPNPPLAEEAEAVESENLVAEETSPVEEEIIPVVAESKPVVSNDWTNYVVPSVNNLRSGSYYVQVASLGNKDNIKNFVDKYSSKYPVVLVQNAAKTSYQIMVGPLNIDEYGAISEKFKDYGFKDSFVRKIK